MNRDIISKMLIFIGILCIVIPLGNELWQYPWQTIHRAQGDEIEPPPPPPPSFNYIDYLDIVRTLREESQRLQASEVLPGEIATEETVEEDAQSAAEKLFAYAESNYLLLGTIRIPRINIAENVFVGSDAELLVGVAQMPGSALPDEEGNVVLSGHRVAAIYTGKQPFRYLDSLQNGDRVLLDFNGKTYIYEVYEQFIVTKYDIWVLQLPKEETHIVTLITCDPVISVGDRLNRLIVRARLISVESQTA